jgi:hypothetical protein
MARRLRVLMPIVAMLAVALAPMRPAAAAEIVDQSNMLGAQSNGASCPSGDTGGALVQTLTSPPAGRLLSAIDLTLIIIKPTRLFLTFASGTPEHGGAINLIQLPEEPAGIRTVRFRLPTPMAIEEPTFYVQLNNTESSSLRWAFTAGDSYPAGSAYTVCNGTLAAVPGADFEFATYSVGGLTTAPATISMSLDRHTTQVDGSVTATIDIFNPGEAVIPAGGTLDSPDSPDHFPDMRGLAPRSLDPQFALGGGCIPTSVFWHCGLPELPGGSHLLIHVALGGVAVGTWRAVFKFLQSPSDPSPKVVADSVTVVENGDDIDGDGLLDTWEKAGIDVNHDGIVDLDLPALGADVGHKDVFLELDWACDAICTTEASRARMPMQEAIDAMKTAFANATVSDPEGSGIALHVLIDEGVPNTNGLLSFTFDHTDDFHGHDTTLDSVSDVKDGLVPDSSRCDGAFGTTADRASANCANILAAKHMVYRYGFYGAHLGDPTDAAGHFDPSFGQGEVGGDDLAFGMDDIEANVLFRDIRTSEAYPWSLQAFMLMHELGHTLGLRHGGDEVTTCKPNYQSVMNALYTYANYDRFHVLDYSRETTRRLDERSLTEAPIGGIPGRGVVHFASNGTVGRGHPLPDATQPMDWNANRQMDHDPFAFDINSPGTDPSCPTAPGQVLTGWNDWANLQYDFRPSAYAVEGAPAPSDVHGDVMALYAAQFQPAQIIIQGQAGPLRLQLGSNGLSLVAKLAQATVRITIGGGGNVPVALESNSVFDARTVDPSTICFGSSQGNALRDCTQAAPAQVKDVNGDGRPDLVLQYEANQTGIRAGDVTACLTGFTADGKNLVGCAPIVT